MPISSKRNFQVTSHAPAIIPLLPHPVHKNMRCTPSCKRHKTQSAKTCHALQCRTHPKTYAYDTNTFQELSERQMSVVGSVSKLPLVEISYNYLSVCQDHFCSTFQSHGIPKLPPRQGEAQRADVMKMTMMKMTIR